MKIFRSPLSALIAFLLLMWGMSCNKDKASKQLNSKNYDAAASDRNGGNSSEGVCDCEYQIIDIQMTPPPNFPYAATELSTDATTTCSVAGGGNCVAMSFFYNPSGACQGPFPPGLPCSVVLGAGATFPTAYIPFNCPYPRFGNFTVMGGGSAFNAICDDDFLLSWTIKYRIRCRDSAPASLECPGYNYQTDVLTYSGSATNSAFSTDFELIGCGCQPDPQ